MAGTTILKLGLCGSIFCLMMHLLLAGDESALSVWEDELYRLRMPSELARFMSPLNHEETLLLADGFATKGLQAIAEENNLCKRAGLLCEKSKMSKLDPCDARKPYKKRKLLDLVQDGFVTGYLQTVMPNNVEGKQLRSNFFRVKEILSVGEKLIFPDFHDDAVNENVSFLPHKIAENIPFQSQQVLNLVEAFHIPSTGSELLIKEMASTLNVCEAPPSSIETKRCVISIEFMVKFLSSVIGGSNHKQNVEVVEGIVSTKKLSKRVVTVKGAKLLAPSSIKHVACHSMLFPFKVYYCHYVKSTNMYLVALKDEKSGIEQNVVAECHMDTKPYPAESLALLDLKLKPGEGEFCHWVPSDTLLFIEKV
ncbi:hypothetical protein SUGI_0234990 [Cryptomeria japonica]|uniref:BURP domain-containing protein 16-like n=1 Tax=Cryptomeria japonica TaxID=3369 RepID=UPI002408E54B|nr:BURP domain-containing protein 16-like [Cryptomeria japonica]GLJ14522.1 hypothetical protein SUGI_0234990 [Cryptomeria japonica]